ncbi:MAG: carbon-nitrogen family hydrolase [Syntrophobacteraceae bacterium]
MNEVNAGCLQFGVSTGDIDANLKLVEAGLPELEKKGCNLLVLPEMWSCGFAYGSLRKMADETPAIVNKLREWAKRHSVVILGSLPEADGGLVYNTSVVIDTTGDIAGRYRKIHLFTLHEEHRHFSRGSAPVICSTSLGLLGIMICYDLRFPELARRLALDGAEILCVSALWPRSRVEHWSLLLRSRAIENQLFVIGCNGCGNDDNFQYGGASVIVSPTGNVLAEAGNEQEFITAKLLPDEMKTFRQYIPCFSDRLPGLYKVI